MNWINSASFLFQSDRNSEGFTLSIWSQIYYPYQFRVIISFNRSFSLASGNLSLSIYIWINVFRYLYMYCLYVLSFASICFFSLLQALYPWHFLSILGLGFNVFHLFLTADCRFSGFDKRLFVKTFMCCFQFDFFPSLWVNFACIGYLGSLYE